MITFFIILISLAVVLNIAVIILEIINNEPGERLPAIVKGLKEEGIEALKGGFVGLGVGLLFMLFSAVDHAPVYVDNTPTQLVGLPGRDIDVPEPQFIDVTKLK